MPETTISQRRHILWWAVVVLALTWMLVLSSIGAAGAEPVAGGTLDPTTIPKYVDPLVIPPAMPMAGPDYYEIAVRQFQQHILPSPFNATTVWSYGAKGHPETLNFPAFTIEAKVGQRDPGEVDQRAWSTRTGTTCPTYCLSTRHCTGPTRALDPADTESHAMSQDPYTGPVPMVTHVHGVA